ncbi:MAG: hypothetical protein HWN66_01080 [Candidatus Helarchaeota archaeon]|nr:hypothetical protein [Candidatus Helarchaeota archaeon]
MAKEDDSTKKVEIKKKDPKIAEDDKQLLEKYSDKDEPSLSIDQRTILEALQKRKTVKMITLEVNLALKPLGKELMTPEKVKEILNSLKDRNIVVSVTGGDGNEYWVDKNYFREKLLGTERL